MTRIEVLNPEDPNHIQFLCPRCPKLWNISIHVLNESRDQLVQWRSFPHEDKIEWVCEWCEPSLEPSLHPDRCAILWCEKHQMKYWHYPR